MKKRCKNPHAVALQVRWLSPERGQETGQTRKRPQAGLVKSRKKRIAARRNAGRSQRRRRRNKRSSRFAPASDTAILARVMARSALPPEHSAESELRMDSSNLVLWSAGGIKSVSGSYVLNTLVRFDLMAARQLPRRARPEQQSELETTF